MADVAKTAPKKVAKTKKVQKPAAHPPFSKMIEAAVKALKDKKGSSRQAIVSYIVANYKVEQKQATTFVRMGLKRAVTNKTLKIVKGTGANGRFRLNESATATKAPKKKKTATKKKAAKKPAGEKKPAAKKAKKPKAKKPTKPKAAKKSPKKKASKPKKPAAKKAKK